MKNILLLVFLTLSNVNYATDFIDESVNFEYRSTIAKLKWDKGNFADAVHRSDVLFLNEIWMKDPHGQQNILINLSKIDVKSEIILELHSKQHTFSIYSKEELRVDKSAKLILKTIDEDFIIRPKIDASISEGDWRSYGYRNTIKIGGKSTGLLLFDLPDIVMSNKKSIYSVQLQIAPTRKKNDYSSLKVRQHVLQNNKNEIEFGIAQKYPRDKNINSNENVYFSENFNKRRIWSRLGSFNYNDSIIYSKKLSLTYKDHNDFSTHFDSEPGKSIISQFTTEKNLALNLDYYFKRQHEFEPEEAYFRYYLMLEPGVNVSGGGKLPGFGGTYNKAGWGGRGNDGNKGWSARGSFSESIIDQNSQWKGYMPIGQYIYEVGKGNYGQVIPWGNELSNLKPGEWYSIEQRLKLNTPGLSDGILEAWVNGYKIFSKHDVNVRKIDKLKIEKIWFNFYFGGSAKPKQNFKIFIDNIVIASSYIGPYFIEK